MGQSYQMGGFQPPPPFTKKLMIGTLILAIIEVIVEQWVGFPLQEIMVWRSFGSGFQPWQIFGSFLYLAQSPIQILLDILMIYFFVPPIQRKFGRKGVLRLAGFTVAISSVFALSMDLIGAVNTGLFFGIGPLLTAMFVVFGLSNPQARILLLFIIPIQASWIAWGSGLLAFLYFIMTRDLNSALWLGGWIAGFAFMNSQKFNKYRSKKIKAQHLATQERVRSKFKVYKGGKDDDTFH